MVTPTQETQLQAAPAEAGFSTNMFLSHPKMGRVQFTFRGATSNDWGMVLEDVDRFLHYMHEKGWKFDGENVPAPTAETTIAVRDENGTPVVDADHNPVTTTLPDGVHLFTVSGLAHDQTKSGKDVLKVWTVEAPYNKGYGVSCFHPDKAIGEWKTWPLMSAENKVRYAPPAALKHVLIRDPQGEGKYPDVLEFRA